MRKIIFLITIISSQFIFISATKVQKGLKKSRQLAQRSKKRRSRGVKVKVKITCHECSKVLSSLYSYELHQARIHNDKEMMNKHGNPCPNKTCPKILFQNSNMIAHIESRHPDLLIKCHLGECQYKTFTQKKFNKHFKRSTVEHEEFRQSSEYKFAEVVVAKGSI